MRDHLFLRAEVVDKLLHLECEGQEGRWARRLRGLVEVQNGSEKVSGAVPSAIDTDTNFVTLPASDLRGTSTGTGEASASLGVPKA